jgi:hypothetical protein
MLLARKRPRLHCAAEHPAYPIALAVSAVPKREYSCERPHDYAVIERALFGIL